MSVKTLTATILGKMCEIGKWQKRFMIKNMVLQLRLRGRHNFSHMARYSTYNESTFRENYGRDFDFATFNSELIGLVCSAEKIAAFDPSYISKSGKRTPGCGYFWSGCAGKAKWGLEIGGFAIIDKQSHTAMHLVADQTLNVQDHSSLLSYYGELVSYRSETIKAHTNRLAVDAYFSKKPFIDKVVAAGLDVITRLRDDADLQYLYAGYHPKRRGAKTKYDGKIDFRHLDPQYFSCCIKEEDFRVYEGRAYSKSLDRVIALAIMHVYDDKGNIKTHKIFCSTDLSMSGIEIFCDYKSRFQIEFLYRDAKQHTGLQHCQSRSEAKLHFHFNTALTAVCLAKAAHHFGKPIQHGEPFSMADIKTQYFNELMLDTFIQAFGICPNSTKIIPIKQKLMNWGKIRA